MTTLMDDLGLSRYCLDIKSLNSDNLTHTFFELVANAAQVKRQMSTKDSFYKDALAWEFDNLFPSSVGL